MSIATNLTLGSVVVAQLGRKEGYKKGLQQAEIDKERQGLEEEKEELLCWDEYDNSHAMYEGELAKDMFYAATDVAEKIEKGEKVSPRASAELIMKNLKWKMDSMAEDLKHKENLKHVKFSKRQIKELLRSFGAFLRGNERCLPPTSSSGSSDKLNREDQTTLKKIRAVIETETVEPFIKNVEKELLKMVEAYKPPKPKK